MATNFNFFTWIREGVKQSVIMGVSDAVQDLGTPRENDDVEHKLMAFLQDGSPAANTPRLTGNAPRKKLGRTLEEIQASTTKNPG